MKLKKPLLICLITRRIKKRHCDWVNEIHIITIERERERERSDIWDSAGKVL